MPGHLPSLKPEALAALRRLVGVMHAENGRRVPLPELVALAGERLGAGITIDFEASRELGQPMVVLRVGAPAGPNNLPSLSRRERDVSGLVAAGLSNKQIARRLSVTLATVKDHVHRILVKAALPNRAAIATAWCQCGGIVPGTGGDDIPSLDGTDAARASK
jgi:DNA-binding CsgD family transcriptional regulator